MEVNLRSNVDAIVRAAAKPPQTPASLDVDKAVSSSFEGAQGLTSALEGTPDVRPEVVERAKELVASPDYPPPEMIKRLANLLAANMLNG